MMILDPPCSLAANNNEDEGPGPPWVKAGKGWGWWFVVFRDHNYGQDKTESSSRAS